VIFLQNQCILIGVHDDLFLRLAGRLDKRYYDTYLKYYPIKFEDVQNNTSIKNVCMRDCYTILYSLDSDRESAYLAGAILSWIWIRMYT
jgi:hypothetical protein